LVVVASISVLPPEDGEAALRLARRLLAQDKLLEPVYRAVMRLCQGRGERALALKTYGNCREALGEELGVEPDRETEDLYRDILTDQEPAATALSGPGGRARSGPSIAILPFKNLTGNESLNFLCEGLAEEISTGLGRFRSVSVIDRYSAAAVAAAASDTTEIGRRLGVALLVQGSIQATPSRLRITVRLVDSASRAQTWSDVFDCALGEAPGIPDQIAAAIIVTVHNRMENTVVEQSRRETSSAAWEYVLRGIRHLRGYAPDDNEKAAEMFREALRLEPDHALAQAYLAFSDVVINSYESAAKEFLQDCKLRIERALTLDPDDGRSHWVLSMVHGYLREYDDQKRRLERALAINPNDVNAMMSYGSYLAGFGKPDEGIATIREAMRLNPFHPEWYWLSLGSAFLAAQRYEDAIEAYKRRTRPKVWVLSRLAVCYAHLGRDAEAREMARQVLELEPDFRISTLWLRGWSEEEIAHLKEGMQKAGLPD
jgi:adenylate cyclase